MITPPTPVFEALEPVASATVPLLPAPSAVPSRSLSRPTTTAPRKRPSKAASPSPAPAPAFSARYLISTGRRQTFRVRVVLTNDGKTAGKWQLTVTHDAQAGVRVESVSGATMSTSGSTLMFSGGPLKPGASATFGFRATKTARGVVRPTACRIDGKDCVITVQRYRNEPRGRTR